MGFNSILLAVAAALFAIGVHQTFYFGIQASYWLFMISSLLYLLQHYRKVRIKAVEHYQNLMKEKNAAHKQKSKRKN